VPEDGYRDLTHGYCLYAKAMGRGSRFLGHTIKCGIIDTKTHMKHKRIYGFQTGDMVRVVIPGTSRSKYKGMYKSRVIVRDDGRFDFRNKSKRITIGYKYYTLLQQSNGYDYIYARAAIPHGY
jgi:hypothetical protein